MDCHFPNARNQAVDAFRGGYYCHFSQIQLSLSAADLIRRAVLCNCKLSLSAADLIRRDVLCNCKSGPMAVLFIKASNGLLQELGRTEVVFNSLSPKWIRKFTVTYQFETVQNLVFHVYDVDTQFHGLDVKALKLEEQQLLGEASCTLSEIAAKVDRTSTLNLALEEVSSPAHTRYSGQLTIYAEESDAETREKLFILMSAGQNHQDEIQLIMDKYLENNQHTFLDLNPMVAIDITGCPKEYQRVRCPSKSKMQSLSTNVYSCYICFALYSLSYHLFMYLILVYFSLYEYLNFFHKYINLSMTIEFLFMNNHVLFGNNLSI